VLGIGESNVTTRVGRLKQRLRDFARPVPTSAVPTSRIPDNPVSEA
jgi:hypothetical protein